MDYQFEYVKIWTKASKRFSENLIKVNVIFPISRLSQENDIIKSNIMSVFVDEKFRNPAFLKQIIEEIAMVMNNGKSEFIFGSETSTIIVKEDEFFTQSLRSRNSGENPKYSGKTSELNELIYDYLLFIENLT